MERREWTRAVLALESRGSSRIATSPASSHTFEHRKTAADISGGPQRPRSRRRWKVLATMEGAGTSLPSCPLRKRVGVNSFTRSRSPGRRLAVRVASVGGVPVRGCCRWSSRGSGLAVQHREAATLHHETRPRPSRAVTNYDNWGLPSYLRKHLLLYCGPCG